MTLDYLLQESMYDIFMITKKCASTEKWKKPAQSRKYRNFYVVLNNIGNPTEREDFPGRLIPDPARARLDRAPF